MSETWTPSTSTVEAWSSEIPSLHVFSTLVFSHAYSGGKRVFALGSIDGTAEVWDTGSISAESWTAA